MDTAGTTRISVVRPAAPTRRAALGSAASAAALGSMGPLAAACGAGTESAPAGKSAAPVTVTYITAANADRQQGERAAFDVVEREAPSVKVDIVPAGAAWADVKAKWQVLHTGGTPPHLAHNGWGDWLDLKESGAVTELTPLFKRDKLVPDKVLFGSTLEHWTEKDQLWALPVSVSVDVLAVNAEHLRAANLAVPPIDPADRSWTVEKFLEYCQKLTRRGEQYGFVGNPSGYNTAGVSAGTWFGRLPWDDQAKKAQMNHPEFIKALQFFKDLRDRYQVMPAPGVSDVGFRNGNASMQVHITFKPALPFQWAPVALPYSGPGKSISGRQFPNAFQMGKVKETDAAWTVLRKLTEPAPATKMVEANSHVVSPLRDPKASEASMKAFQDLTGNDGKAYFNQQQYCKTSGYGLLKYAEWGTLQQELTTKFNDFMADKMSAQAYAEEATRRIDQTLGARK